MTIRLNPDSEYTKAVRAKLAENDNYCPCRIEKTPETKCMCKEFRDMIDNGEVGSCHCGLYIVEKD